ncbi:MAG: sel1 repeat family protein [Defluviitaleaceae bacterium]|nr:sel1 repeat family protein [Defluviitaleaceae bacterium]
MNIDELKALSKEELFELAEQGNWHASLHIAREYRKGEVLPHNLEEAVKWYHTAASQMDEKALFSEGASMYKIGKYELASIFWLEGANRDDARCQACLAELYEKGQGVTQNYYEAERWFFASANQGYDSGQYGLGVLYYNKNRLTDARNWFQKAAEQGHLDAQKVLNERFDGGRSLPSGGQGRSMSGIISVVIVIILLIAFVSCVGRL